MDINTIYNNLNFLDDSIRLQYTNFIYKNFEKLDGKMSLEEIVNRLRQDEPIEYVFNLAEFCGLEFFVDKRVLIPRIETEEIVEKTLQFLAENSEKEFTIIDIGTGSGAIILSLAKQIKSLFTSSGQIRPSSYAADKKVKSQNIKFIGIDISLDAIEVARINREKIGLEGVVDFEVSDFQDFDFSKYKNLIILANLPYIPNSRNLDKSVEGFEPHLALFGGQIGDELVNKLKVLSKKLKNLRFLITEEDYGKIVIS